MKVTFLKADETEEIMNWAPDTFLDEMRRLPLAEELSKADRLQLCSPTVSMIRDSNEILWGSIINAGDGSLGVIVGRVLEKDDFDLGEVSFDRFLQLGQDFLEGNEIEQGRLIEPRKKGILARLFGM